MAQLNRIVVYIHIYEILSRSEYNLHFIFESDIKNKYYIKDKYYMYC